MTSKEYIEATQLVAKLSAEERIKLTQHLKALTSIGAAPSVAVPAGTSEGAARAVIGQLLKFARAKGLTDEEATVPAINRIMASKVGKGAFRKCETLWSFVSEQTSDRLKREALLQLGFRLHYDELRTWIDVVTINEMLRFLERVPASFDGQFPGYASQGLLGKIVSAKRGK